MRDVFFASAKESLGLTKMDIAPEAIADSLIAQHGYAPYYKEVPCT